MINLLKQLGRTRTSIKLQPSGCNIITHVIVASYSYNKTIEQITTHVTVIKLFFGCFLKAQAAQKTAK